MINCDWKDRRTVNPGLACTQGLRCSQRGEDKSFSFYFIYFFFLKRDSKKIKLIAKKFLLRCKKLTGIYLFTDYSKDKISDIFEEIEYPWKIFIEFSCTNQYIYIYIYTHTCY